MKNRNIAAIALVVLFAALLTPGVAAAASGGPARFLDEVGLLTPEQTEAVTAKLDQISLNHRFDVVIAVVWALDHREARLFAVDFFEQNGFGFGDDLSGAILLLATRDRDFGFASLGFGLKAFTPAGQEYLDKLFLPYLKEDLYYEAFMAYAEAVDGFLTKAEAGEPYDKGNIPLTASERETYRLAALAVSLGLALVIAFCVTFGWRRQLVSVRREELAHGYIREGSMVLTAQKDIFLYRQVHKVRRPETDKSSSSGGSGGSFTSSSGNTATGHSGKY